MGGGILFLALVLSWIKTYHHAKFQRNPLTGLARMMVQTDRQTDRQTSLYVYIYIYIYIYGDRRFERRQKEGEGKSVAKDEKKEGK